MRRRFLYYLPNTSGCNPRMMAERGLLSRFSGAGNECVEHSISACDGPEGAGVMIGLGARPAAYLPAVQTWEKYEHYWLGLELNDARPAPEDLVREVGFGGYEIELNDQHAWRIPMLRRWSANKCEHVSALPKSLRPINGRIREAVNPQYEHLDVMAAKIWEAFVHEEQVTFDDIFFRASALLGVNYRIGFEEAAMLGLFNSANALRTLMLGIDIIGIEAHAENVAGQGIEFHEPTIEEDSLNG